MGLFCRLLGQFQLFSLWFHYGQRFTKTPAEFDLCFRKFGQFETGVLKSQTRGAPEGLRLLGGSNSPMWGPPWKKGVSGAGENSPFFFFSF